MKERKTILFPVIFLLLTGAFSAAGSSAKPDGLPLAAGLFGINEAPKDSGAKIARVGVEWRLNEPQRGVFSWQKSDQDVMRCVRDHLAMMYGIGYSAAWNHGPPQTPDADAEYAAYVGTLVSRYKDRVKYWEIWNEPNIPSFWKPQPAVVPYTALLKAAYAAAHKADPNCVVVGASANEVDLNWLLDIAKNGGMPYMDAVSIHPYTMADSPDEMDFPRQLEDVKTVLRESGRPDLPIWITEMGLPSDIDKPETVDKQARFLVKAYAIAAAEGVPCLLWFNTADWHEKGHLEGWGLLTSDRQPKASYGVYQRFAKIMEEGRFEGYIPFPNGMGYVFQQGRKKTLVAWARHGQSFPMTVPAAERLEDIYGKPVAVQNGRATVGVSPVTLEPIPQALLRRVVARRPAPASDNVVVNGSLSEADTNGAYGWHRGVFYGGETDGTFAGDVSDPARPALTLSQTKSALWESYPVPALPGETYTLSAQIKTTDAAGDNGVQILFLRGPGWGWAGGPTSATITGSRDWKTVTVSGVVPTDCDVVRVNLVSKNNPGIVAFRDIKLVRQANVVAGSVPL